ncbi:MAG: hypothetical protein QOH81_1222 [Sphingomonadales bacterium]|jgi:hypothetical protein|nr:hypothetical protein [Sphingomonadales bacterium]
MLLRPLLAGVAMLSGAAPAGPGSYVIRPAAEFRAANSGFWVPDAAIVAAAKAALLAYLHTPHRPREAAGEAAWSESRRPEIMARIDDYALQFMGVGRGRRNHADSFRRSPRRAVLINGVCRGALRELAGNLETQLVAVLDGGSCFFRAVYDPRSRRIVAFDVNGAG